MCGAKLGVKIFWKYKRKKRIPIFKNYWGCSESIFCTQYSILKHQPSHLSVILQLTNFSLKSPLLKSLLNILLFSEIHYLSILALQPLLTISKKIKINVWIIPNCFYLVWSQRNAVNGCEKRGALIEFFESFSCNWLKESQYYSIIWTTFQKLNFAQICVIKKNHIYFLLML